MKNAENEGERKESNMCARSTHIHTRIRRKWRWSGVLMEVKPEGSGDGMHRGNVER